jgi:23S rRNA pseudouridine1911/1915/1917 synthase
MVRRDKRAPPPAPSATGATGAEAGGSGSRGPQGGGALRAEGDAGAGVTVASVVRGREGVSWERARELVRRGKVKVNDARVTDPAARVAPDARVTVDLAAPRADRVEGELEPTRVVFLDEHLVVVDKPHGVSTIPYDEGERGTLIDRVQAFLHRHRGADRNAPLFVVHRIDKDTSGLVVFGRSWAAKRHLAGLFRAHAIERRYLALVCGHPARDAFTVDTILLEDRGDGLRGSARKPSPGAGKRAITHIQVLARLDGSISLARCQLETGRTHQIRIHLAESGHPLVGERVYGRDVPRPVDHDRALLHAHELGFSHPVHEGRLLRFRRDPPEDFLARLRAAGGALPEGESI